MEEAIRKRIAAKGWLTKVTSKLENLCNEPGLDLSPVELTEYIEDCNQKLRTYDEAQSVVDLLSY